MSDVGQEETHHICQRTVSSSAQECTKRPVWVQRRESAAQSALPHHCSFGLMIESGTTHLWCQTLEERRYTLFPDHVPDNGKPSLAAVEVGILYTCLDDVEGRGDGDGCDGTSDGRDKIWT